MARTKVQAELIATNAISGTIIADNAITATHIATNSISGTLVQDSGIVTTMIANNNVTATKIVTDAIQTRHIADDQVTAAKLANSINTDIAAKAPLAGPTFTGDVDIDGSDDLRLRFLNGSTFKGGIQVPTSTGDMISGAAVDDLAIRSQGNILFSSGGNTEMVRIQSTGKVGIGTAAAPDTQLHLKNTGAIELRLEADSNNSGQEDCFIRFYTDGKTQEGLLGMDNNNSSTLFTGNTENAMVFGCVSNLPVVFATNNTERMQIGADGDVHIGDTGSYTGMFTVNDTTASSNKIIAHFQGQGNGADTTTGGQYISVNRTGPISSASNGVQGGLILGSNSATGPGCAIQSVYQYTNGRDMRFLTTHNNTSDPSVRMALTGAGQLCLGLLL